jgi:hypothetical protein
MAFKNTTDMKVMFMGHLHVLFAEILGVTSGQVWVFETEHLKKYKAVVQMTV